MAQVHKFSVDDELKGEQYVAHGVYVRGNAGRFSVWFGRRDGITYMIDAERHAVHAARTTTVYPKSLAWKFLAQRLPELIAQYEREHSVG